MAVICLQFPLIARPVVNYYVPAALRDMIYNILRMCNVNNTIGISIIKFGIDTKRNRKQTT